MKIHLALSVFLLTACAVWAIENLAWNASVTASANTQEAPFCVSTNLHVRRIGWRCGVQEAQTNWIQFDLGKQQNVGAVIARWITRPAAYFVSVSADGETFHEVGRADAGTNMLSQAQGFGFPTEHIQFVRLHVYRATKEKNHGFTLSQVEIYEY